MTTDTAQADRRAYVDKLVDELTWRTAMHRTAYALCEDPAPAAAALFARLGELPLVDLGDALVRVLYESERVAEAVGLILAGVRTVAAGDGAE